jgi:hypothetical protein
VSQTDPPLQPLSAVEIVAVTPPSDDSGAETYDRYDWQAAMAAGHILAMYLAALDGASDPEVGMQGRLICERHEDWCAARDDSAELVSAKHREPSQAMFTTLNQLVTDGGIAHLFSRWRLLKELPYCRLATSGNVGPGQPKQLKDYAEIVGLAVRTDRATPIPTDSQRTLIVAFADALSRHGGFGPPACQLNDSPDRDDRLYATHRFAGSLTIEDGLLDRHQVSFGAPLMYARPILDRLGDTTTDPVAVWTAVLNFVRLRMRDAAPLAWGALPDILWQREAVQSDRIERDLAGRIVTVQDIAQVVETARQHPRSYGPLPVRVRQSRAAIKMEIGRCNPNTVGRADFLRLEYRNHWRDRIARNPTARADRDELQRTILRITDQATSQVVARSSPWGDEFWREVELAIAGLRGAKARKGLTNDLILGGLCELAAQCHVWFSDPFDVDALVAARRMAAGDAR